MDNQSFNDALLRILEKEDLAEKWKKKLRIVGKVIKKKVTKKGSFMLTIKIKRTEYDLITPKHRKDEFEAAKNIFEGDFIKAAGDRNMGVVFCDRIEKLKKQNQNNEKQTRLLA